MFKNLLNVLLPLMITTATAVITPMLHSFLKTKKRKDNADTIYTIADDVVGELAMRFPDSNLMQFIDGAVSDLKEATGLTRNDVAQRAIKGAITRLLASGAKKKVE